MDTPKRTHIELLIAHFGLSLYDGGLSECLYATVRAYFAKLKRNVTINLLLGILRASECI